MSVETRLHVAEQLDQQAVTETVTQSIHSSAQ